MTEHEAERFASVVRRATGLAVDVEPDDQWFAVVVRKDRGGIYTLYDEKDWRWLAKQIGAAAE